MQMIPIYKIHIIKMKLYWACADETMIKPFMMIKIHQDMHLDLNIT